MHTTLTAPWTSVLSATAATARRCVAAIGAWYQAQRDYHLLCQLEDNALRDLGLNSSDLRDATTVGLFGDPTSLLSTRANERHRRGTNR